MDPEHRLHYRGSPSAKYYPVGVDTPSTVPLIEKPSSLVTSTLSTVTRTLLAVLTIATVSVIVISVVAFAWSYDLRADQARQDDRADTLEAQQVSAQNSLEAADAALATQITDVNTSLCDKVMALNTTLQMELGIIELFLNISNGNTSFTEILTQTIDTAIATQVGPQLTVIQGDITTIQGELSLRIKSVDGVSGDNATLNVDFIAGLGTAITPTPAAHTVQWDNTGVVTINGIPSGVNAPGELEVAATGMLTVVNEVNNSKLTVDGSAIVGQLVLLQGADATQAVQISALQAEDLNLQTQITALEGATSTLSSLFNGTDMDVDALNTTLVQLLAQVAMAQAQLTVVQNQLANFSSTAVPPGAMMPFGGTDATVPAGYLLCDGSEYDISAYPTLASVLLNKFCTALPGPNCSTVDRFAVPDMRGRVPVGRKTGGVFDTTYGTVVGSETEILSVGHLPSHDHGGATGVAGAHSHTTASTIALQDFHSQTVQHDLGVTTCSATNSMGFGIGEVAIFASVSYNGGFGSPIYAGGSMNCESATAFGTTSGVGDHAHTVSAQGSGMAHPNVQPSMVVLYIIKT